MGGQPCIINAGVDGPDGVDSHNGWPDQRERADN